MSKRKKVFVLSDGDSEGGLVMTSARDLKAIGDYLPPLSELEDGDYFKLRVVSMTKEELDQLGDFEGF